MIPAWLSVFDAIVAMLLLIAGVGGAHFSLLPSVWSVDPAGVGFYLMLLSFLFAVMATLIGLLGIARTAAPARRVGRSKALAGTLLGLAIAIPLGFTMRPWTLMRPGPDANSSLVGMRSRDGAGDFDLNHARSREFFAMLKPGADAGTRSPS
jgi:hypothetical protein